METNKTLLERCRENLREIALNPWSSTKEKELAERLVETIGFVFSRPGTFENLSRKDLITVLRSRWYNHYHIKDGNGKLLYYTEEEFAELWQLSAPMLENAFNIAEVAHAKA